MIIDVFQDTVCPWCRIGKQHLLHAIQQWDGEPITLRFRSFFLDPNVPKEGLPFQEWMASLKGPEFVQQMQEQVTAAGKTAGLTFRFDRVEYRPNTLASHMLIKLASEDQAAQIVEAVYQAYFEDGLDIGNLDVLVDIAEQHGMDGIYVREQILSNSKRAEIEEDLSLAQELQITGVPFFVVDNKLALAGAHPPENFLRAFQQAAAK